MKKIIAATSAAVIGATVLLASPAQASAGDDRLFYRLVTKEAPALKGIKQRDLVKTAKQTCDFLRTGYGILDAHDLMTEAGFTTRQANAFLAGAIVFYCPEQEGNY